MKKTLTIVTPMLNSMRTLDEYMKAIQMQTYNHSLIDIIVPDGGSKDGTIDRLNYYNDTYDIPIQICDNPLVTAEAGKAVGVRIAKGEIILLLDSDNIIPEYNWIERMMAPFEEDEIVATEPISFTWRKEDPALTRYFALMGLGDPLCMFTGNYDRYNYITNKWTTVERDEEDKGDYLSVKFRADMIPTIGANGFFIRKKELVENFYGDYLFDIDVLWELFLKNPALKVAKVKTGIVHLFCPNIKTFIRKQNRRIMDYLFFSDSKGRKYPWSKVGKGKITVFGLCTVTTIPLIIQLLMGNSRKSDIAAWIYHIPTCWVTLLVYGFGVIKGLFKKEQASRDGWKQ